MDPQFIPMESILVYKVRRVIQVAWSETSLVKSNKITAINFKQKTYKDVPS